MIFLLDNYDSFTYNLYQILLGSGCEVLVRRNDEVTASEVLACQPTGIVLSPGPGRPENSGIMQELIGATVGKVPLFGVCLGMHGIGMHFGGKVAASRELMHGKTCAANHDGTGVFVGLPSPLEVMRYHSLALVNFPEKELLVSSTSGDGEIMAFRHKNLPVEGVQFHPESYATEHGETMLRNFLDNHDIS